MSPVLVDLVTGLDRGYPASFAGSKLKSRTAKICHSYRRLSDQTERDN